MTRVTAAFALLLLLAGSLSCKGRKPPAEAAATGAGPGAEKRDPDLSERLLARLKELGPEYKPRTRHLLDGGAAKFINRLILETSPYLHQHAHNPVDWYPWGEDAFEAAKRLGRPILLSIGYSTCHWCHVMEEESFEDLEIANYLNENYVAIKVDREERPDIDAIYIAAVQMLRGSGGWPLTVWLTPEGKPFFGGTYIPPRDGDRGTRVGFLTLLKKLREAHRDEPEKVAEQANRLATMLQVDRGGATDDLPGAASLHRAAAFYTESYDQVFGGLRTPNGNKFPSQLPIRFLLRYHRRTGNARHLEMAMMTLGAMASGGLRDHIGGGFHRYSTDARWLVPHFEKMLYDNALLAVAYLEAYQATGRQDFAFLVRETLDYVAREMTGPEGAFYSATDADSMTPKGEREEGYFFTWTPAEVREVLDDNDARIAIAYYGITDEGNFEGRSIPNITKPLSAVASELGVELPVARDSLARARELLYEARAKRPAPLRDDKILAAWNGLMVTAFARGGMVLGDAAYLDRARKAASFLLEKMVVDGRLRRSFREGSARLNGYLEDYAFVIAALLDLFEATGETRWLKSAVALDKELAARYEDAAGGFYRTSDDHEQLLVRDKPSDDGAVPSGNSVATMNLLRLHELTSEARYLERADRALRAFGKTLTERPAAMDQMLLALDFRTDTPREIVIVAPEKREQAEPLLAVLRQTFVPNRVVAVAAAADVEQLAKSVPLAAEKRALKGEATAYVCERGRCELPTSDPDKFAGQIRKIVPLPPQEAPR